MILTLEMQLGTDHKNECPNDRFVFFRRFGHWKYVWQANVWPMWGWASHSAKGMRNKSVGSFVWLHYGCRSATQPQNCATTWTISRSVPRLYCGSTEPIILVFVGQCSGNPDSCKLTIL